ncbi:MAG TPA: VWA domain-containing protein [Terriglobales bacterium]|nr:VWA domain-containing protein [Terriglobales bacterium]
MRVLQTRFVVALVLVLFLSVSTKGAQNPSEPTTTLSSRTELVSIPVIATDKFGAHVHGLKKEDFTVLEEGVEQKIAVLEEIQIQRTSPPRDSLSAGQFSNLHSDEAANRQLTIVVIDMLNTPVADQVYAKDQIVAYLTEPGNAGQPMSLLALNRTGVKLIHHFTRDKKELTVALNGVQRSQQPVTEDPSEAFLTNGTDKLSKILQSFGEFQVGGEQAALSLERRRVISITLDGMQQIAQAYMGYPGRKTLIWASGGFPFALTEETMALKEGIAPVDTPANMQPLYEKTWAALNRAQISVYPVYVHGLGDLPGPATAPVKKPLPDPFTHGQWLQAETNATFEAFAKATAGRAYLNQNGLQRAMHQAVDDTSSYYLLGYYLRREDKKEGWRKLHVNIHREGVHVLARTGFFMTLPSTKTEDGSPDSMQAALDSPLEYTGISITAKWQEIQPATEAGKKKATFTLTMPPGFAEVDESDRNRFAIDFWAAARTSKGVPGGDIEQTMEGHLKPETYDRFRSKGIECRGALTVASGEYTVRFVVRDRLSGRIGTVSVPLKVSP